ERMSSVNNVQVVGEFVSRLGSNNGREELATDESSAGNIECNCIAVLRLERRAAFTEVETRFVHHVGAERRSQRGHGRVVFEYLNARAREIVLPERLVL